MNDSKDKQSGENKLKYFKFIYFVTIICIFSETVPGLAVELSENSKKNVYKSLTNQYQSQTGPSCWFANFVRPGEVSIGKPCKESMSSLGISYSVRKLDSNTQIFFVKKANKLHPDITSADFFCTNGQIDNISLGSKEFKGKDALFRAKQLTDKIISSLNLLSNGWKLISSDLDGTQTGWRTGYARTYQRDNIKIVFEANYTSREEDAGRWVEIQIKNVFHAQ